ncbi:MAG TPA: hypothetical protein VET88_07520 [Gammaproteobacteria bacterium]|nr:hypothetical protein [Gammaproteobacteria bacterium]
MILGGINGETRLNATDVLQLQPAALNGTALWVRETGLGRAPDSGCNDDWLDDFLYRGEGSAVEFYRPPGNGYTLPIRLAGFSDTTASECSDEQLLSDLFFLEYFNSAREITGMSLGAGTTGIYCLHRVFSRDAHRRISHGTIDDLVLFR